MLSTPESTNVKRDGRSSAAPLPRPRHRHLWKAGRSYGPVSHPIRFALLFTNVHADSARFQTHLGGLDYLYGDGKDSRSAKWR
jgi:hypothetical protein